MLLWAGYICLILLAPCRGNVRGKEHDAKLVHEAVSRMDEGTYRWRVSTVQGPAKDHISDVDIIVPPLNVSIRTDNNDDFEAGTPRVLACIVFGCVHSPNVTWYLGDTMLRPNVYKEVNRGNFTVSSLTFVPSLTDNGKELVCKATSDHMTKTFEDRVTITVGHRPICIDSGFKTIGAVEGDSETLVCIVESDPEPEQFIWTFADGRTLYTSSKKVFGHDARYSSTLVWVPRLDDFGPLYCRGSNRFGEQKQPCTFSIINGGPPNTPDCQLSWQDNKTMKVRCLKNWDGGRQQTIHVDVKSSEGTRKFTKNSHEFEIRSRSLHPTTNYTAEIYASNSRGRSMSTLLDIPFRDLPDVLPPEAPYTTKPTTWARAVVYCTIIITTLLLVGCLLSHCICKCCKRITKTKRNGRTYSRGEELHDFTTASNIYSGTPQHQVPQTGLHEIESPEYNITPILSRQLKSSRNQTDGQDSLPTNRMRAEYCV